MPPRHALAENRRFRRCNFRPRKQASLLGRPAVPEFFRTYPEISVDLHLTDAHADLIGEGFDAALRIAIMEDSSFVARLIAPVRRFVVASPPYLSRYGRPQHPHDLGAHQCLTYTNRTKRDV